MSSKGVLTRQLGDIMNIIQKGAKQMSTQMSIEEKMLEKEYEQKIVTPKYVPEKRVFVLDNNLGEIHVIHHGTYVTVMFTCNGTSAIVPTSGNEWNFVVIQNIKSAMNI